MPIVLILKYYNMINISENDDIYDHLIIDSTKCIILVPYDEKNKPLGITDVLGETYSYFSFRNKEDMHYYGDKAKHVKKYLKMCRKVVPDALVFIDNLYAKFAILFSRSLLSYTGMAVHLHSCCVLHWKVRKGPSRGSALYH